MALRPELRDEVLNLSREERHQLAEELYESLSEDPVDPEWERAWSRELGRRIEDVAAGRVELIDAEVVHARIRAKLRASKQ